VPGICGAGINELIEIAVWGTARVIGFEGDVVQAWAPTEQYELGADATPDALLEWLRNTT
jgi:hypothetical protein